MYVDIVILFAGKIKTFFITDKTRGKLFMNLFLKTVIKSIFRRKIFVLLIIGIVYFSAIFTSFSYRIGLAFAYVNTLESNGDFTYTFYGDSNGVITKDEFNVYFEKYEFIKSTIFPLDDSYCISLNGNIVDDNFSSLYVIYDTEILLQIKEYERYFSEADVINKNKIAVVSNDFAESVNISIFNLPIYVNNVEYTVVAVEDLYAIWGSEVGDIVLINSDELVLSSKKVGCSVYTEKQISNYRLKKIAENTETMINSTKESGYIVWFAILSFLICLLFAVNIFLLFNYFVKANDKFYAIFKILGIKSVRMSLAMALSSIMMAFVGASAGILTDYLLVSSIGLMGNKIYLGAAGSAAVLSINIFCSFSGAAFACYIHAKRLPAESLGRVE